MPREPNGERRPAGMASCAVTVARIATGEDEETSYKQPGKRKGGLGGGKTRAIAQKGTMARWDHER
jgi:hypothetical protein